MTLNYLLHNVTSFVYIFFHQVATLLEENEELLEKWFFNEMSKFSNDLDTEIGLRTFLCVDNVKGR